MRRSTDAVSYGVWSTVPFFANGEMMIAGMRVPGRAGLSRHERADIVAFLRTLTDGYREPAAPSRPR